ncbi:hypothetical protein [Allomesorhizobium camelthorni]|uniref:Uncharacterized protein n=1 Tax=Allomesorhizobium camelthorni TaxID=475069 RepID=A0A6G4W816_9HYPH|nr:hypothetical protein [Mesorhizobium camelthorni]NGO50468.1 hypothetical protein [Mesorhizobium camelthorni]
MTTETDRDVDIRELYARYRVLEAIQTQLLLTTAARSGDPKEFVQSLMLHVEETFRMAKQSATAGQSQAAVDAVDFLRDYSMRLIAALTPNAARQ